MIPDCLDLRWQGVEALRWHPMPFNTRKWSWSSKAGLLAASYFAAGKLAMLMAIPPGYATAVWPAAGLALAGLLHWGTRFWPAVWLGSFLVNASLMPLGESATAVAVSLAIACAIALGAALQAAAGSELIRRTTGFPTPLDHQSNVGKVLLLGGPVSCLVNATVGVGTLFVTGAIRTPQVAFSWWTWWVGDTIGVLLITPLVLIWTAEPRSVWRARRAAVAAPLLICATLVVTVFVYVSAQDERRIQGDFKLRTDRFTEVIRRDLAAYEESIQSIRSYYEAAGEVDRASFRRFVARALQRHPGIRALGWAPLVAEAEREAYENAARRDGLTDFEFVELTSHRNRVPAAVRAEHVVAYYLEPIAGNEAALGFDVASDPIRVATLKKSIGTNAVSVTPRIDLIQERRPQPGIIAYLPVYAISASARSLRGFAVGVFRMDHLLDTSLNGLDQRGVDLQLVDLSAPATSSVLCALRSGATQSFEMTGHVQARTEFFFGGRRWSLRFAPSPEYAFLHRSWYAWAVLALGLLFTSLLGAFLLVVAGRSAAVELQVEKQTAELSQRERQLRQVVQTAHDAFLAADAQGCIVEWNPAAEAIFGWTREEVLGHSWLEMIFPAHVGAQIEDALHVLGSGDELAQGRLMEVDAVRRSGREFPVELTLSPVRSPDQTWRCAVFLRDVSAKREVDRRIRSSLKEKEVLLKEIHHRVKNNLQVISSLLSLQAQHTPNMASRALFADSQARVQSIALIHEALYRSENLSRIRFDDYLRNLVDGLLHSQNATGRGISASVETGAVELSVDRAIPCGLIINELVTNALKYAFRDGRAGKVDISLQRRADMRIELAVTDDGMGLPEGLDPRRTTSLGLDLVFTFAEQLDAEVEIQRQPGTSFRFVFAGEA